MDECEVVGRELIVAGCHTPTVLDLVEESFDQISSPVKIRAEAKRLCPISFRRDIRPSAILDLEMAIRPEASLAIALRRQVRPDRSKQ